MRGQRFTVLQISQKFQLCEVCQAHQNYKRRVILLQVIRENDYR
jgi:hypothetical protein